MLTFRLNSRPLQQRIEGMERRTSVRETSHDILYEPRTRAARACIAAGVPVASSCIPSCAVCVADRTPVGPQIVFAFPRRYAAGLLGLLPPRPGSRTTSRRLRGRQGRHRGHRRPLARVSTMCCVCAGEGAVARAMAAEDAPCGRVRRARVRPDCTHPDGGRRVECQCVRVSCARSCVCRVYMYCMRA